MRKRAVFHHLLQFFKKLKTEKLCSTRHEMCCSFFVKKRPKAVKFFEGTTPWNAGFFFINISRYRNENFRKVILGWLPRHNKSHPIWKFGTQPLMELSFFGRWIHMDTSWYCLGLGVRHSRGDQMGCPVESAQTGAILHWNGVHKPWNDEGHFKHVSNFFFSKKKYSNQHAPGMFFP